MNLSEIITRVADDGNTNSGITSVSDRIIREINRISQEIWESYAWSFRWRNYRIVTDVDVTIGTVTATNGSRTITGSGTSFLSSHATWHIYFPGDSILNWYRVRAYTSGTQLELDVPYQGTTGILKNYILRHFDYTFPTETWDLGSVIVTADNKPLTIIEPMGADVLCPVPLSNGSPEAVSIFGSDLTLTTYSTGTLSGTISTKILTGVGTSWLDNIFPGDSVTIGSYVYQVQSVDSDTQITLYNNQQVTSSGATYSISRQFGRLIRFIWPSTYNYTVDIRALRRYAPLINSADTNELIYRFPNVVILKAASLELKQQNDLRSRELSQEADLALARAKADDDSLTKKSAASPIFTYRGYRGERLFR